MQQRRSEGAETPCEFDAAADLPGGPPNAAVPDPPLARALGSLAVREGVQADAQAVGVEREDADHHDRHRGVDAAHEPAGHECTPALAAERDEDVLVDARAARAPRTHARRRRRRRAHALPEEARLVRVHVPVTTSIDGVLTRTPHAPVTTSATSCIDATPLRRFDRGTYRIDPHRAGASTR